MKKIKLENINVIGHNRITGKKETKEVVEYACSNCRQLIDNDDIYCWHCGEELSGEEIEHYSAGKKLTNNEFVLLKKLSTEGKK